MRVTIGVTTYGTLGRVNLFMNSLRNNLDPQFDVRMICVDDGTRSEQTLQLRSALCKKFQFHFLQHGENRGIPAAWNSVVEYAYGEQSDIVCIFNDDISFLAPGWLSRIVYFFEHNNGLGTVGLPLCNSDYFDDSQSEAMWGKTPGLVGAAVGCAFAGRPETLLLVDNPDGSHGYWEDLISFHEEVHEGFRLAEKGYASYMLPWPPVRHRGGQTFQSNPELIWRSASPYLPVPEFLAYARASRFYVPSYEAKYEEGQFDRMMYSRAMFCKYWGILGKDRIWVDPQDNQEVDIYDEPQRYVHRLLVDGLQGRELTFMNKTGQIEKVTV